MNNLENKYHEYVEFTIIYLSIFILSLLYLKIHSHATSMSVLYYKCDYDVTDVDYVVTV